MDWREIAPKEGLDIRLAVMSEGADNSLYLQLLESALAQTGKKTEIVPVDLPASEFDEAVKALIACGFRGAGVGNPHKVHAARVGTKYFLARDSVGVANALMFDNGIYARNTEIEGFSRLIEGIEPSKALVIGSGQAARSVVMSLFQRGWKVRVWNRNAMKSRVLQTMFKRYDEIELAPDLNASGCRLVINTTPVGLKPGEQLPLAWQGIQPKTVFVDLVIRRVPTEMLRAAKLRGLGTISGREMLLEQTALAAEWWTGQPIDRKQMAGVFSSAV